MSLVDELLAEEAVTPPRPTRQKPTRSPSAPIRPQSSIQDRLRESVQRRRSVTISAQEARALVKLIERSEDDPFSWGGVGKISTDDLKLLGLKMAPQDEDDEFSDPFFDEQTREEEDLETCYGMGNEDPIPASAAITAPDATPGGDEDVPADTLRAMQALLSSDEEVPLDASGAPTEPTDDSLRDEVASRLSQSSIEPEEPEALPQSQGGGIDPAAVAKALRRNVNAQGATESTKPAPQVQGQDMVSTMKRWRKGKTVNLAEKKAKEAEFLSRIGNMGADIGG